MSLLLFKTPSSASDIPVPGCFPLFFKLQLLAASTATTVATMPVDGDDSAGNKGRRFADINAK